MFQTLLYSLALLQIPLWVLIKEQERNWRGTLLAVLAIGIISGLIIIAALFVTYNEKKIHYQRLKIEELLWVSKQNRDPLHFWHQGRHSCV
ncbi:hypothetical protein FBUS_01593 [Fasciolopsis buskii]|uniref:Uncharacterized protein n=1 Tax=Fasciolopsis buskii TaxID=27845 RepID=A0A8E0RM99_9TREM|nr:hypothetical protein FBUS_01593 [Fasciolopsis buski]